MFEIHEVRKYEKIKSEKERELDRLRLEFIDERIGTERWFGLAKRIDELEAEA